MSLARPTAGTAGRDHARPAGTHHFLGRGKPRSGSAEAVPGGTGAVPAGCDTATGAAAGRPEAAGALGERDAAADGRAPDRAPPWLPLAAAPGSISTRPLKV